MTRLPDVAWSAQGALLMDLVTTITSVFGPDADDRDERKTLAWYLDALARRDRFVSSWDRYFEGTDALILPAALTTAFEHCDHGAPVEIDGKPVSFFENGRVLGPCNAIGLPGLSAPAGVDGGGLPIGVQIVGPRWSEMRLLEVARALEHAEVLPGFRAPHGE